MKSVCISGVVDPLSNKLTMLITLRTMWFMGSKKDSQIAQKFKELITKCFLLSHVKA